MESKTDDAALEFDPEHLYDSIPELHSFSDNLKKFESILLELESESASDTPYFIRVKNLIDQAVLLEGELRSQFYAAKNAAGDKAPGIAKAREIFKKISWSTNVSIGIIKTELDNLKSDKIMSEHAEELKELSKLLVDIDKVTADQLAINSNPARSYGLGLHEPVDSAPTKEEDQAMSATTDKDYIDARLKAMSDSLDQRLETAAVKSDGRLEVIETRMDARIASLDERLATGIAAMDAKFDANFARFESMLHKTTADIHKGATDAISRVVAIVSGLVGVGIAVIVLVIANLAPKPAVVPPAPVVIYAQPAPAAAAPQAAAPQAPAIKH